MRLAWFFCLVLLGSSPATSRAQADYGPDELIPIPPAPGAHTVVQTRIERSSPAQPARRTKIVLKLDRAGRVIREDWYARHGAIAHSTLYTYTDSLLTGKTYLYRLGMTCDDCLKPVTDSPLRRTSGNVYRYERGLLTENDFLYYTPDSQLAEQTRERYDALGRTLTYVWRQSNPHGYLRTEDSMVMAYVGDTVFTTDYNSNWTGVLAGTRETVQVFKRDAAGKILLAQTLTGDSGSGHPTAFRYDGHGRFAGLDGASDCETCPGGVARQRSLWQYDAKGRLVRTRDFRNGRNVFENQYVYFP